MYRYGGIVELINELSTVRHELHKLFRLLYHKSRICSQIRIRNRIWIPAVQFRIRIHSTAFSQWKKMILLRYILEFIDVFRQWCGYGSRSRKAKLGQKKENKRRHLKVKRDEIKNQIECRSARWVSFLALSAIVVSGAPHFFFQAKRCLDGAGICCGVSSPGRCGSGEAGRGNQCRPLNTGSLAHRWWGLADQLSRFDAVPYILFIFQCCGAGSVGSVCFWVSRIQIH